ncbi:MAG TPA: hypothetical protein ENG40_04460 [Thermoprotei archaeon]|nr:hypothetical protein [Thermoprotei archaeon]
MNKINIILVWFLTVILLAPIFISIRFTNLRIIEPTIIPLGISVIVISFIYLVSGVSLKDKRNIGLMLIIISISLFSSGIAVHWVADTVREVEGTNSKLLYYMDEVLGHQLMFIGGYLLLTTIYIYVESINPYVEKNMEIFMSIYFSGITSGYILRNLCQYGVNGGVNIWSLYWSEIMLVTTTLFLLKGRRSFINIYYLGLSFGHIIWEFLKISIVSPP